MKLKKAILLQILAFYCNKLDPVAEQTWTETHGNSFHASFVGSYLYRGNLTLLSFLEKLSNSKPVQKLSGGRVLCGVCERVENDEATKLALKEALLEVYKTRAETTRHGKISVWTDGSAKRDWAGIMQEQAYSTATGMPEIAGSRLAVPRRPKGRKLRHP